MLPTDDIQPADLQQRLAIERTELAHQRTLLAEERTYSAWIRTGLAAIAAGFVLAKLVESTMAAWMPRVLGALFIVTGASMFMLAFLGYRSSLRRVKNPDAADIPLGVVAGLTFILLAGSALGLVLVAIE